MMNEIGKGKFSTVYLGINEETKEKVAIKQISKSESLDLKSIYNEINIHKILFHPYICRLYYIIENPNYIFIVTEYCRDGEILKNILELEEPYEEPRACQIFTQILSALEYLHNNNISHRDIKLENMLLDEYGDAKLTDFGLSKSFKGDIDFNESAGSPMYAAPEVLLGQPHKGYISDIWSLGICLYVMVCGDFPFISENMRDYIQSVAINKFELPEYVSPLFIDLINKILAKNPKKRLNIKQIKEHPWLHSFDFNFMKSPGVIINRDILPIDVQVIKDIVGYNEKKIRNVINDILMNKHNNNTILYYLKIEKMKRNKITTVSDIRPTSDLFLNYINNKKSKIEFYGNNINKKIDEITQQIILEFKNEEYNIRKKIKDSLNNEIDINDNNIKNNNNINNNNINNNNNNNVNNNMNNNNVNNNINNNVNNKKRKIRINNLLSKTFKFEDFKNFLKEEEEQNKQKENNEKILKKNKLELLNEYIGPLIFIHDIIDDIITKAIKLNNRKEIRRSFFPVCSTSINIFGMNSPKKLNTENNIENNNKLKKINALTIDTIEEFEFLSTVKKKEKKFMFKFYKPKNSNKINLINNIEKIEIKINKKKLNETQLSDLAQKYKKINYSYMKRKSDKGINDLKIIDKKFDKKVFLNHLHLSSKNTNLNLSRILNKNNFSKIIKDFKTKIEKSGILGKKKIKIKKALSHKQSLNINNKLNDNEDINKNKKDKKRINSYKNNIKLVQIFLNIKKDLNKDNEKDNDKYKEKQNNIKFINNVDENLKKIYLSKKIKRNSKNIDEKININEISSEKGKKNTLNTIKIIKLTKKGRNIQHNKNCKSPQISYNKKILKLTLSYEKKKSKKAFIFHKSIEKPKQNENQKFLNIENENKQKYENINKSNIIIHTKAKTISNILTYNIINTSFYITGRNQRNHKLLEKCNSTIDSSSKKKINNTQLKKTINELTNFNNIIKKIEIKNNNKNIFDKN